MSARRGPFQAQDKLTFLLSLVPFLIDHERISVTEVAAHFSVPENEVRDAVRLIAVSGVPGDTGQYQHGDLFDLAWDAFEDDDRIILTHMVAIDDSPRFSGREAAALIAGLQYLSSLPEHADRAAITSLMAKLSRGASAPLTQVAVERSETDTTLELIRDAVAEGVQLEFDYLNSRGEHEHRLVDPLLVQSLDTDWYLRAWCHLREAIRTFRLDRISDPKTTSQPISDHADDVEVPEKLFDGSLDDLEVTIDVAPAALSLLDDYISDDAERMQRADRVRTTIHVSHYHSLKRLVAGMPGLVTVVAPPAARAAVAEWASAGAARYDEEGL